jgi:hypothetical protein
MAALSFARAPAAFAAGRKAAAPKRAVAVKAARENPNLDCERPRRAAPRPALHLRAAAAALPRPRRAPRHVACAGIPPPGPPSPRR